MPSLEDVKVWLTWHQPPSHFTRKYCILCVFLFCLINFLDQADRWAVPTLQVRVWEMDLCECVNAGFV